MRFEFATSGRIVFGEGMVRQAAPATASMGKRALVVSGHARRYAGPLLEELRAAGIDCRTFSVPGEPSVALAGEGARLARESGRDVVIGIGGGSVLDGAKAIAALATNGADPLQFLEVIGRGQPLRHPPLPVIAIPTTAGTGSEATRNAVLSSAEHRVKVSLRSAWMLPRFAIIDPELTVSLPPDVTASTGLDALTQLIEPYVSARANPMTDIYALDGIRRARESLVEACENGANRQARAGMSLASLFGGICLANAGLGVVHGLAAPIGGMFDAPHGAICAALLAHGMTANIRALAERGGGEALERYATIARLLTGDSAARAEDGAGWVAAACERIKIRPLGAWGVKAEHIATLVEKASAANSMKANPIRLETDEVGRLLEDALRL
ncbi:MAG: iron-containing alcohol dehydrogenase [Bryobacterales bacterium]|nr:iron-containing alcohol dehydrogenase [Bryobacterales bacterium]